MHTRKILVTTDFSSNATRVYPFVVWLAQNYDYRVDLIHVIPKISYLELSQEVMGNPFEVQKNFDILKSSLIQKLNEEMTERIPETCRGKVFIVSGMKVPGGIVSHLENKDYELVICGSHGRGASPYKRGSTTEKLIQASPVPVLSITKKFNAELKHILVTTDGSKASLKAMKRAISLAAKSSAKVHLLSVIRQQERFNIIDKGSVMYEQMRNKIVEEITDNLTDYLRATPSFSLDQESPDLSDTTIATQEGGRVSLSLQITDGTSVPQSIIEYAHAHDMDMVVMTTHGRNGLSGLFIGSVAEKVVRHLDLPILTINPNLQKAAR